MGRVLLNPRLPMQSQFGPPIPVGEATKSNNTLRAW